MRVCPKHFTPATKTLVDRNDGTEYDLCQECYQDVRAYFEYNPREKDGPKRTSYSLEDLQETTMEYCKKLKEGNGPKRTSGRPKKAKN